MVVSAIAFTALLGVLFRPAEPPHQIHTTVTEIRIERGVALITIRAFADDFGRAVHGLAADATAPDRVADTAAFAYVRSRFSLHVPGRGPLIVRWAGMERREDAYLLRLTAAGLSGLSAVRVANRMHEELYADQVNIVQATAGGERASVLFLRGDGPKLLRR